MAYAGIRSRKAAQGTKQAAHQEVDLFLQGGGALGAYQGGAFAAMAEAGISPDWVSGISIGAINAAIIAGNKPEDRAKKLEQFWKKTISAGHRSPRSIMLNGVENFFAPAEHATENTIYDIWGARPFYAQPHMSRYDPSQMYDTLRECVDFKYLNSPENPTRLSVGAADYHTREQVYFDTRPKPVKEKTYGIMRNVQSIKHCVIGPEHIMASAALISNFPPVKIDGRLYIDGGLVSNNPVRFAHENGQLDPNALVIRPEMLHPILPPSAEELLAMADPTKKVKIPHEKLVERQMELSMANPRMDLSKVVAGHIHTLNARRTDQNENKFFDFSSSAIHENWDAGYRDMQAAILQYRAKKRTQQPGTHVEVSIDHSQELTAKTRVKSAGLQTARG